MSTDHIEKVFQDFYSDLVNILPMNDETFMAELFTKELLPGDLKQSVSAKLRNANEKSNLLPRSCYQPYSAMGDRVGKSFKVLLRVMQDSKYINLKNLAGKISESSICRVIKLY